MTTTVRPSTTATTSDRPTRRASAGAVSADAWRKRDAAAVSRAYSRYSDLVVERAEGAHLHTVDGRDVLDLGCGIGVTNLGHNHPAVTAAVHAQVDRLWHTSVTALSPPMIEAAEAIVRAMPSGLNRVFLANSGAEAVDGAIKLARRATGRSEIIAFDGGFHGRTYGALSLTASKARYHAGMGPFLPGVHHVRYPEPGDIERLLQTRVDPDDVACIVVEPVLGEGGYVVPPRDFLPALRRLCDANGILLVTDEVQSGVARTGRFLAAEHSSTVADIVCLAKGLGNGMPVAAIVAGEKVMNTWQPGDHGSTFGGNPVACAAVSAVLDVIERERLCDRAARLGEVVLARAAVWRDELPGLVADVRGLGLMVGVELRHRDGRAAGAETARVREEALRRDVLVLSCGVENNVIRLLPPLTIPEAELTMALDRLEASLRTVAGASA